MITKTHAVQSLRNNRFAPRLFLLAGLIVFGFSGWLWWSKIYSDPSRVFYDMLNQSLQTSSVTRKVTLRAQGNSLGQIYDLTLGTQNRSHNFTTIKQSSQELNAEIITESYGTPQEDYTRFTAINTQETNEAGVSLDFSSLVGVWGRSDEPGVGQQSFNEALLSGAVPIANLPHQKREQLLSFMRKNNVFEIDESALKRSWVNGRQVYTYTVTIREETYKPMLQEFTSMLELGPEEGVDLSQYEGFPTLKMELTVDVLSRQLTSIKHLSNGRFETYSGYGLKRPIDLPQDTVPLSELQKRLQSIR